MLKRSLPSSLSILLAALLAFSPDSARSEYVIRVPVPDVTTIPVRKQETPSEQILISLASSALPSSMVRKPYNFDLSSLLSISGGTGEYNLNDVTWSLRQNDVLPQGLTLTNGVISGTPTTKNEEGVSFEITGSYQGANGNQIYTIIVNGYTVKVKQLTAGNNHTCALTEEGGVKCWGYNQSGQLGNGTTKIFGLTPDPVDVSGMDSGIVSISAGGYFTCALTNDGGVKCWGNNTNGNIGDGTTTHRLTPVGVAGLDRNVIKIAAGGNHACAVMNTNEVKCWGSNSYGQLGNGNVAPSLTPVKVIDLDSGIASIDGGKNHVCAVTVTGQARCWGGNTNGQLGDGTTTDRSTPVNVTGLETGVREITSADSHSCAATNAGGVWCWGDNTNGQLGDGSLTQREAPVLVGGLSSGVLNISTNGYQTCAVTNSGGVKCWGNNSSGQLGNDSTENSSSPVDVIDLYSGAKGVVTGYRHACAITSAGAAKCWGNNFSGQLGNVISGKSKTPVDVIF